MAEVNGPSKLSQSAFAKRRGVNRATINKWKGKGLVVFDEAGRVDVEASEWNLDQRPATYRGGVAHRPVRAATGNKSLERQQKPAPRKVGNNAAASPRPAPSPDIDEPGQGFDLDAPNLSTAEAVRRKENMLGLLRKRELEVANNEWVRVEEVGGQVEREYAMVRERLLAIPGKIAALLVGLDRPAIEARILREVTEALNELHDPGGLAERVAARGPTADRPEGIEAAADPQPGRVG